MSLKSSTNSSTIVHLQAYNSHGGDTPPVVFYTVAVLLSLTFLLGTFFNTLILCVFARNKHLRTPTYSFLMALSVCDISMCLLGTPIPIYNAWRHTPIRSHTLCIFDGFVVYFFGLSSMYLLAAIAVDRYVVIVRPLASLVITDRLAWLAIGACFLLGLVWTVLPVIGWNRYVLEGIGVACSISWEPGNPLDTSYIFVIFVCCMILPLAVMAVCYVNIYLAIRTLARQSPWSPSSHVAETNFRLQRKLLKTVIVVLGAYLVSWTPYAVVSLSQTFSGQPVVGPVLETFPAIFAKMSVVWDPVIYIATNPQFRKAFYELADCCGRLGQSQWEGSVPQPGEMVIMVDDGTNSQSNQGFSLLRSANMDHRSCQKPLNMEN